MYSFVVVLERGYNEDQEALQWLSILILTGRNWSRTPISLRLRSIRSANQLSWALSSTTFVCLLRTCSRNLPLPFDNHLAMGILCSRLHRDLSGCDFHYSLYDDNHPLGLMSGYNITSEVGLIASVQRREELCDHRCCDGFESGVCICSSDYTAISSPIRCILVFFQYLHTIWCPHTLISVMSQDSQLAALIASKFAKMQVEQTHRCASGC